MSRDGTAEQLRSLDRGGLAKLIAILCLDGGDTPRLRRSGTHLTVHAVGERSAVPRCVYWIDADGEATPARLAAFDRLRRRHRIRRAAVVSASAYPPAVREAAEVRELECLAGADLVSRLESTGADLYVSDLASDDVTVDLAELRDRADEPLVKDRGSDNAVYFRNVDF